MPDPQPGATDPGLHHVRALVWTCAPCNRKWSSQQEARDHKSKYHPDSGYPSSSTSSDVRYQVATLPPPPSFLPASTLGGEHVAEPQHESGPQSVRQQPALPGILADRLDGLSTHSNTRAAQASPPRISEPARLDPRAWNNLGGVRAALLDASSPSSLEVSGSRPSRMQTPHLSDPEDGSAPMHVSQLSLDDQDRKSSHAHPPQPPIFTRPESGSPSKKRPASSEADGGRVAPSAPGSRHPIQGATHMSAHGATMDPRPDHKGPPKPPNDGSAWQSTNVPALARDVPATTFQPSQSLVDRSSKAKPADQLISEPYSANISMVPTPSRTGDTGTQLIKQVTTVSISSARLAMEATELYKTLEIVEKRCIDIDARYIAGVGSLPKPTEADWKRMTDLHRTLMYEHHDYLLSSQHCNAPADLQASAIHYQLPFRLWKHGIHGFLEVLRLHLPDSLELLESFIAMAYQMMALLYESVPKFQDVWTECLGDLARYRMAIEFNGMMREIWCGAARWWYGISATRLPLVGRCCHHLGILSRPELVKQLFYYCKSLCCVEAFPSAKHSLGVLFDGQNARDNPVDRQFVQLHGLLFEAKEPEKAETEVRRYVSNLGGGLAVQDKKWKSYGMFLAICNIAACVSYGEAEDPILVAFQRKNRWGEMVGDAVRKPETPQSGPSTPTAATRSSQWQHLACSNLASFLTELLSGPRNECAHPHVHVVLVFLQMLSSISSTCPAATRVLESMPWEQMSKFLNVLPRISIKYRPRHIGQVSPHMQFMPYEKAQPLMEDDAIRGHFWCGRDYFPKHWFDDMDRDTLPEHESDSAAESRAQRMLWTAAIISLQTPYLEFDKNALRFTAGNK